MVNQFGRALGKITRAEAAELCHLSKLEHSALLKRMLKRVGSGRGTYYAGVEKTHG